MVLVTGGTGLVGSHLLYHLIKDGKNVKAIYRNSSKVELTKNVFSYYTDDWEKLFNQIKWYQADLLDIPSLEPVFENIELVYHCAALISFLPSDYKQMRKTNIIGTENIVNLCISNKIDKLCFVSSIATLEKKNGNSIITEENYWQSSFQKSGYAITKHGAEMEIWRGNQEGIKTLIVNPGVILGEGFWHSGSGKIFDKIYNGFNFYTQGKTGFVDVEDVVKSMINLTENDIWNERFILVGDHRFFKDLFFEIADLFEVKRPTVKVTKLMGEIAWRLDSFKNNFLRIPASISKHSLRSSQNESTFSSDKLKKTLQFEFTPLDTTLQRVCKNFQSDQKKTEHL